MGVTKPMNTITIRLVYIYLYLILRLSWGQSYYKEYYYNLRARKIDFKRIKILQRKNRNIMAILLTLLYQMQSWIISKNIEKIQCPSKCKM